MAKVIYKSYTQNDNLLFPPSLGDFIAENDPVRVLNTIVDHLDLSKIEATYAGGGTSSYHPRAAGQDSVLCLSAERFLRPKDGNTSKARCELHVAERDAGSGFQYHQPLP